MTDRQLVKTSRIVIVVEACLAGGLAMLELPMLMNIAIFTFEHIVHVFPTAILGILWHRGNRRAAWTGLLTGLPVTVLLGLYPEWSAAHFGTWAPGILGLVVNIAVYVVVSLCSKPESYVEELFEEVHGHLKEAK